MHDAAGGLMGRIDTGDGFFFNYDILCGGGIVAGSTGLDPTAGDLVYTANLRPYRNSTQYTAYAFIPLTAPLTNTSWELEER